MELEMTIDDPNIIMGGSKMEDITKLVQLYMVNSYIFRLESKFSRVQNTRSMIISGRNFRI